MKKKDQKPRKKNLKMKDSSKICPFCTEKIEKENYPNHVLKYHRQTVDQHQPNLLQVESFQERKKTKSLVPCNAPGGMFDFAKYVQDGGYVPEAVRNAQVGLELEVFASNPGDDIKNRSLSLFVFV